MAIIYEEAEREDLVYNTIENLIKENDDLDDLRILVNSGCLYKVLYAENEDDSKPSVVCKGNPAYAVVRVVSNIDRVTKKYHFEIIIDKDYWFNHLSPEEKESLIYHELYHVNIARTSKGEYKYNPDESIKIRLRKHDLQYEGFSKVIEKFGKDSIDFKNYIAFSKSLGRFINEIAAEFDN